MKFTLEELARMTDLTAVRADCDDAEVRALAEAAKKFQPICVCTLPGHTPLLQVLLTDEPRIGVVGAVGFPSGGNTTATKVAEAKELLEMGCSELDMVINIGLLRSGVNQRVLEDIRGVVAFGSWARDELVEGSDVDLLIVLDPERRIDRSLYRAWDRFPLAWAGYSIEPHFVHLPEEGRRITGLWAEVSIDGIVLFDAELSLSRRMAEIRRRIASGEVVRRWEGGHPYWVGVA